MPPRDLPEDYYLRNVQEMIDLVADRDDELLRPHERAFARDFCALSSDARRLWVRLVSRKGPLFRADRLAYPEIGNLAAARSELCDAAFLDEHPPLDAERELRRVRLPETLELAADLIDAPLPRRKKDLVGRLLTEADTPAVIQALSRWTWLAPLRLEELEIVRLLFFGNLRQDWTQFVLRDLGIQRFEAVPLQRELHAFPDRATLDEALVLHRLRGLQFEAEGETRHQTLAELGLTLLERGPWRPGLERLAGRILATSGRAAERMGDLPTARRLYEVSGVPPSRERLTRVLEKLGNVEAALGLADEMARSPLDETEARFGPMFGHRLRRRLNSEIPRLPRPQRPRLELEIPSADLDQVSTEAPLPSTSIEDRVLAELERRGRPALFAENWLWTSLVGLAFWDILFAPIPGAFLHPFQTGPLDLSDPAFRSRRHHAISLRLDQLRDTGDLSGWLLGVWDEKEGLANRFVAWSEGARDRLEMALQWVGGSTVALVADRMLNDPRRYRRGLPDLLLASDREPGFELWEIKGPGDTLRPEQATWIDHLNAVGIPATVVDVRWPAD